MRSGVLWMLLVALILGGCASRQHYQLVDLPLPAAAGEGCCWQASQQLEIRYQDQVFNLNAALARTQQGASLVLLDPLGRRLLSIRQQGAELEVWRSPEMPADLPERFLLASSMFVWWPLAEWRHLQGSDWSIVADTDRRELYYRGKGVMTAVYHPAVYQSAKVYQPADAGAAERGIGPHTLSHGETVELIHQKSPLRIWVKTLGWGAL